MKLALLLSAFFFAYIGQWAVAALFLPPLAILAGYSLAIRRTGVGMVQGGTRRIITGRL